MKRIVLLACVGLFVGCGQTRNPSNNGEPSGDGVGNGDSDFCPVGFVRDGFGACVKSCAYTEECNDAALICNTQVGLCVAKPPDEVCNPLNCGPGMQCPPPGGGVECVAIPGWCDEDGGEGLRWQQR